MWQTVHVVCALPDGLVVNQNAMPDVTRTIKLIDAATEVLTESRFFILWGLNFRSASRGRLIGRMNLAI